jgi:hypothetical protein
LGELLTLLLNDRLEVDNDKGVIIYSEKSNLRENGKMENKGERRRRE